MSARRNGLGPTGAARIAAERKRQIESEGYDHVHDDAHRDGALAWAAACYAAPGQLYRRADYIPEETCFTFRDPWPWDADYDTRPEELSEATIDERIALLTKAGALCAAEIDRLVRKKAST